MPHDAVAEEGAHPPPRPVDYLVGDEQVSRLDFFFETAAGVDGDNLLDADGLQGVDIRRCGISEGRSKCPLPCGQEGNPLPVQLADGDCIAGMTERCINAGFPMLVMPSIL